jgi:hypothetical protein
VSSEEKNRALAQAAEQLVKAAQLEVDSVTQLKLTTALEGLKDSLDTKLNSVQQVVIRRTRIL